MFVAKELRFVQGFLIFHPPVPQNPHATGCLCMRIECDVQRFIGASSPGNIRDKQLGRPVGFDDNMHHAQRLGSQDNVHSIGVFKCQ